MPDERVQRPGNAGATGGATGGATPGQRPGNGGERYSPYTPLALHPPSEAGCTPARRVFAKDQRSDRRTAASDAARGHPPFAALPTGNAPDNQSANLTSKEGTLRNV